MANGFVPYSGIWKFYYPYRKRVNLLPLGLIALLCCFSYFLGVWQHGESGKATESVRNPCPTEKHSSTAAGASLTLDFGAHHGIEVLSSLTVQPRKYEACDVKYSEYTPCEDHERSLKFNRNRLIYRERHCPAKHELLKCLIPAPFGYKNPFPWPVSRDLAWYANVPHRELTVEKAGQNWIRVDGDKFRFPGGGTMFPNGADAYIGDIERLIPLRDGSIRTAVDTGCGVASWGAFLLSRNITAMSIAPRDTHEAQVQFALERGVPAMIGVIASKRLPYPSRAFDMAHCSRCLIPWHADGGLLLMEVDRILRPGGYWILSGPPINWKRHWRGWQRSEEDLNAEQTAIEKVAKTLCWKKLKERGDIAIWQKPTNHIHCKRSRKVIKTPPLCSPEEPDAAWYENMKACITPLPEVGEIQEIAGGQLAKWPERLTAVPPRISSGSVEGITAESFIEDNQLWRRRVSRYKNLISPLAQKGRYRNLLDMNAHLGGFAAALIDDPLWVMNVVPTPAKPNTLGVVYERGLIGTYQDWCIFPKLKFHL
ncbi:probable methyltransferase PMT15 isoform X1 [Aristolochia californica]|uniref:probable methyltransferase PMT15 isoform X1 n=1 Tax=Aristolochia californica TaxID=171875 RepID=UPI0035DC86D5